MSDPKKSNQETNTAVTDEYLSFLVGQQDYCVEIKKVREIRGGAQATTLPHSPKYLKGVINLRGTVLPIMDLSLRLGQQAADTLSDRNVIIVVATEEQELGLMVDAVSDILPIPDTSLQQPPAMPADGADNFISALTIHDEKMIRVLNLENIMPNMPSE